MDRRIMAMMRLDKATSWSTVYLSIRLPVTNPLAYHMHNADARDPNYSPMANALEPALGRLHSPLRVAMRFPKNADTRQISCQCKNKPYNNAASRV